MKMAYGVQVWYRYINHFFKAGPSPLLTLETAILHPPPPYPAAAALRKLGRCDEATASLLRAAATADPRDAHVHYKLGQHLRSVGGASSCALAAEAYSRALALDPGHALAAFWLQATRKRGAAGDWPARVRSCV